MAGASVERNIAVALECEWKKRKHEEEPLPAYMEIKRPRQYYIRLESESSVLSEDDTESIYSIQDRETDFVRDTSDTDTDSIAGDKGKSVLEIEYEVDSLSENEDDCSIIDNSSSGTEDIIEGAIAAAICDSSLDVWSTDIESSEDSSMEEFQFEPAEFYSCIQCKSRNDNPNFRYCDRCYQVRKTMFPPRPRGRSRKRSEKKQEKAINFQNCLSQDSGLGSSQEVTSFESIQSTNSTQTILASSQTNLASDGESIEEIPITQNEQKTENDQNKNIIEISPKDGLNQKRKRSLEDEDELDNIPSKKQKENNEKDDKNKDLSLGELCIICNTVQKDSAFLHGSIAHRCCCYKCSMKVWKTNKRCPACNGRVQNVVKVFTI